MRPGARSSSSAREGPDRRVDRLTTQGPGRSLRWRARVAASTGAPVECVVPCAGRDLKRGTPMGRYVRGWSVATLALLMVACASDQAIRPEPGRSRSLASFEARYPFLGPLLAGA